MMKKNIIIISVSTQKEYYADFFYFFLKHIKRSYDSIYLVPQCRLSDTTEKKLLKIKIKILDAVSGTDYERWRYGLEYVKNIDINNITLCNDTMYGPLYSINNVIKCMNIKECDFWGITKMARYYDDKIDKIIPEYVEEYFISYKMDMCRKTLLEYFGNYENKKRKISNYLASKGLKYEVYVNTSEIENNSPELAEPFSLFYISYLIKEYRCPFVSRNVYNIRNHIVQLYNDGMDRFQLLDSIKNKKLRNYIYKDQIKQHNIYDLVLSFPVTYIIPKHSRKYLTLKRTAIFCYLFYENDFEYYCKKIKMVKGNVDVYLYTDTLDKAKKLRKLVKIKKCKVIVVESRGREWAVFLNELKNDVHKYEYACFLHDKNFHENEFPTQAFTFRNMLWDSLLPVSYGVNNIIGWLEKNKNIGVLLPPIVKCGTYIKYYVDFWMDDYDITIDLARKINIETELIHREYPPISIGGMFWFRVDALHKLFEINMEREEFDEEPMEMDGTINHALERIIPYVAQDSGYYSGFICTEQYLKNDWIIRGDIIRTLVKTKKIDIESLYTLVSSDSCE